jgi:Skp family chaperone for outer membrane proteins
LAADFEAQRDELGRKSDAQMRKIFAQIDVVLAELAKDKDNAIIIERDPRLVLYAAPALDITPEVVKRLNQKKLG